MRTINTADGQFHDGNQQTGELGTIVTADWLNAVQTELVGVVQGLGGVVTPGTNNQIRTLLLQALSGKQAALGFAPVQQGTGVGQESNAVKIGWSALGKLKATVDVTDLGTFAFEGRDNTFTGQNTFNQFPIVPTADASDNSLKAANTAFVQAVVTALAAARLTQAQADARYAQLSGGQTFANPITVANRVMVSHGGDADGGVDMVDPGTNGGGSIRWIDGAGWVGAIEQRSRAAANNAGLMSLSNGGGFSFSIGGSSRVDIRNDQIVFKSSPVQINPGDGVALDLLNTGGNNYGRTFNLSTTGGSDGPFMTFNRFSATTQSFWQLGVRPESDSTDFAIGTVDNGFGSDLFRFVGNGDFKGRGNIYGGFGNASGETTLTLGSGNGYFFTNPNSSGFNTPGSVDGYWTYNRATKNLTVSGWAVWHDGIVSKTLAQTGYRKLPDGSIEQWGITNNLGSEAFQDIVFPIAFPNACFNVQATIIATDVSDDQGAMTGTPTKNGVRIFRGSFGGGVTENLPVFWRAIGN